VLSTHASVRCSAFLLQSDTTVIEVRVTCALAGPSWYRVEHRSQRPDVNLGRIIQWHASMAETSMQLPQVLRGVCRLENMPTGCGRHWCPSGPPHTAFRAQACCHHQRTAVHPGRRRYPNSHQESVECCFDSWLNKLDILRFDGGLVS
jgi:hypothetical protein